MVTNTAGQWKHSFKWCICLATGGKCWLKQYICSYVKVSLQLLLLPKTPAVTLFIFFTVYWIFLLVSKPLMDPSWGREQRARESTRFKAGWFGSWISRDEGGKRARAQPACSVSPSMNIWCVGLKPTLWTLKKKKKSVTAEKCSEESGLPKLSAKVKKRG